MSRSRARLFSLLLLLWVCVPCTAALRAQQPDPPPAPDGAAPTESAAPADTQPADDLWNFDDEEEAEPTLAEIIRPQALDLALFSGFAVLTLVGFFRKSEPLKYLTLVVAVVYLGYFRSQMLSIVNIFGLITWNLPIVSHSLFWYFFAIFTVVTTILWGRLYCGRVCAYGALTQLMDRVLPAKLRIEVPDWLERRASYIKYGMLAFVTVYFLITGNNLIYKYTEPFWMYTGNGTAVMWTMLGTVLIATVFVRNMYCRFLCPFGAFLGLLAQVTTVFRIKRWAECKTCKICEKTCEWGAIQGPKIVRSECVRCDDCERLYLDEQKCPHWIIIRRKSDVMARQSGAPALSTGLSAPTR